jgi:ketosteroid isomerase-like protein
VPSTFEDTIAIQQLLAGYCHAIDALDADRWVTYFSSDGEFDMGNDRVFRGPAELRRFVDALRAQYEVPLRHFTCNVEVSVDDDSATARSALLVVGQEPAALDRAAYYDDQLRRIDGQWKIVQRRVRRTLAEF